MKKITLRVLVINILLNLTLYAQDTYNFKSWDFSEDGFYSKPSIQTSTVTKLSDSDDNYEQLILSLDCTSYGEIFANLHYTAPGINSTKKKWWNYVGGIINVSYNLQTFEFGRSTTRGNEHIFQLMDDETTHDFIDFLLKTGSITLNVSVSVDDQEKILTVKAEGFKNSYDLLMNKCQ